MLRYRIEKIGTALHEILGTGRSILLDPARRADLIRTNELGAEFMRGGLPIETEHPLSSGTLYLRSLLQIDGDLCTTFGWRSAKQNEASPSSNEWGGALAEHHQAINLGMQPLRDLANLLIAGVWFLTSLFAAIPPMLELALTDSSHLLHRSGAYLVGCLALIAGPRMFHLLTAYLVRRWWYSSIKKLNSEGDNQRSSSETI